MIKLVLAFIMLASGAAGWWLGIENFKKSDAEYALWTEAWNRSAASQEALIETLRDFNQNRHWHYGQGR